MAVKEGSNRPGPVTPSQPRLRPLLKAVLNAPRALVQEVDPETVLETRKTREDLSKKLTLQDLENWGFGLDKVYFGCAIFVNFVCLILMIIYSVNRAQAVSYSSKNMVLSTIEQQIKPLDPKADPKFYPITLPAVYLYHTMSPHSVFLPYPLDDTRISLHTQGFNSTGYVQNQLYFPVASAGEFLFLDGSDTVGGLFPTGFKANLAFHDDQSTLDVNPGNIFHLAFTVVRNDNQIPGHIAVTPVLFKLGHPSFWDTFPQDWYCYDGASDNTTYLNPSGSYLIRYHEVIVYKDNSDMTKDHNILERRMRIGQVLTLQPSPVHDPAEYAAVDPGFGPYMDNLKATNFPAWNYTNQTGTLTEILHVYLQYEGEMIVSKQSYVATYTWQQAISDVSGAWSFALTLGINTLVVCFMVLRRKKLEEEERVLQMTREERASYEKA